MLNLLYCKAVNAYARVCDFCYVHEVGKFIGGVLVFSFTFATFVVHLPTLKELIS